MKFWQRILCAAVLAVAVTGFAACGDSEEDEDNQTVEPDPEPEAQPEQEPEAQPDAQPEAQPDAQPEAQPEAEPDAEPDAEPEAEPDPEPEACVENGDCQEEEFCALANEVCEGEGVCTVRPENCTEEQNPVCGCDNDTYGNACLARQAGVNVASRGECEAPVVECSTNGDCDGRSFCECAGEACGEGVCDVRPTACSREENPVCGCDSVTYNNDCERRAEGVCLLHTGSCDDPGPENCGGFLGGVCEGDLFCDITVQNACMGADLPGVCVEVPDACPRILDPVCGCDGQTYGNDCERVRAGVQLDHEGECESDGVCGGFLGALCLEGQFCDLPAGECNTSDLQGLCVTRNDICPQIFDPVCGCDGETYGNDCFRIAAGVQKDADGECVREFDCDTRGNECRVRGEFCDFSAGTCNNRERFGFCEQPPRDCPRILDPVCGCDGMTYSNDCLRRQASVTKDRDGACR